MILYEKNNITADILNILMTADAISCDPFFEPITCADTKTVYQIPSGYYVVVDFNKMATAIYEAGFRKADS